MIQLKFRDLNILQDHHGFLLYIFAHEQISTTPVIVHFVQFCNWINEDLRGREYLIISDRNIPQSGDISSHIKNTNRNKKLEES